MYAFNWAGDDGYSPSTPGVCWLVTVNGEKTTKTEACARRDSNPVTVPLALGKAHIFRNIP